MRLLLIRHGQTPSNVTNALDTGRPGGKLTSTGLAQARALPQTLATEEIAAIGASALIRTQLTAEPLASSRKLTVDVLEGIEEIGAGGLEMRNDADSVSLYADVVGSWARGDLSRRMPGGHDGHAFFERYDAAIGAIAATASTATVAVISHGAAIRLWAAVRAVNLAPDHAVKHRLQNTGFCIMEGDPDAGWTMMEWRADPLQSRPSPTASFAPTGPDR
jgi:broad specificity phosphatase PhoE